MQSNMLLNNLKRNKNKMSDIKKTNWQLAQEENINGYIDGIINQIKEHKDKQNDIIDNLIAKCEEIRMNILKEVK